MTIKPQLAEDAILEKVKFPCIVQPKIDGVRALNLNGTLTGRSLKPFEGFGITERFSGDRYLGLDGEMILGTKPNCTNRLCSLTTGAMGRFQGVTEMPDLQWNVFDIVTSGTVNQSYNDRYWHLARRVDHLHDERVKLVQRHDAINRHQLDLLISEFFDAGYEGVIIRNPNAPYKPGRATQKGQELWRVKSWADAEILVTGITEGEVNMNEAKKNALGRTERSSAKAGMVPNGQVGSIQGVLLADFHCPITGKLLFPKDLEITVGSGEMTVAEAERYFKNPKQIIGHIVKFKHMTHGVKDKPRFPTYISHRLPQDMT